MRSASYHLTAAALLVVLLAFGSGCVAQERYDAAIDQVQEARRDARIKDFHLAAVNTRQEALMVELRSLDVRVRELSTAQSYTKRLEELMAQNVELALRLQRAELTIARINQMREGDTEAPGGSKPPLEEMDVRRITADARAKSLNESLHAVQALVDSGMVKVTMRDGRVRFHLPRRLDETDPYTSAGASRATQSQPAVASPSRLGF